MKIEIKGFKNVVDVICEIPNGKLSTIFGLSGSGKSAISDALSKDPSELNKTINFTGNQIALIDGKVVPKEKISVYNEDSLKLFLTDFASRNNQVYSVFVDDENEFQDAREKLNRTIEELKKNLNISENQYSKYKILQRKLGADLSTKNGAPIAKLKPSNSISKVKKSLKTVADTNLFREISTLDIDAFEWLLGGIKTSQFNNGRCPFCDKILNKKITKKYLKYKGFDSKSINNIKLDKEDQNLINHFIEHSIKSVDTLESKMIDVALAINQFDKVKEQINMLEDNDFLGFTEIIDSKELFKFFPNLKKPISTINLRIEKINKEYQDMKIKTKSILGRNVDKVNFLLESFGIPYQIEATYKQSRIDKYVVYHKEDSSKIDRSEMMSEGEKKILSLILFVVKNKKENQKLIIFDDPVSSYDNSKRFSIFNWILNELSTKTVLIMSHDQSFAKFAVNSSQQKLIGKTLYFENFSGITKMIDIYKSDFINIKDSIRHRIDDSSNYMQKIINLRYYEEIEKNRYIYSYLSDILHRTPIKSLYYKRKNEEQIIEEIEAKYGIKLPKFDSTLYLNIDTSSFEYLEKIFLLRDLSAIKNDNRLISELSYHIHLNGRELSSLDPYRFTCISKYLYEKVNLHIKDTMNYT